MTPLDRSPMMVLLWRTTPGRPVEFASRNLARLGYKPEQIASGQTDWREMVHLDDREKLEQAIGRCMASANEIGVEFRVLSHAGVRWVQGFLIHVQDDAGNVTHVQASLLDATDAHCRREGLEQRCARLSRIFHEPSICFLEIDVFETWHYMKELEAGSRQRLEDMFRDDPAILAGCVRTLKVIDVNRNALRLLNAASKDDLVNNLFTIFGARGYEMLRKELLCLYEGKLTCNVEGLACAVGGRQLSVRMDWHLLDDSQSPQMCVLVVMSKTKPVANN